MPQADHAASRRRVPGRDSRVHGFCRRISYIYHAKPLKSPAMKIRKLLLYLGIVLSGLLTASCAVRPPRPAPVAPPAHHRPGPPRDRERPRPPKRHDKPPPARTRSRGASAASRRRAPAASAPARCMTLFRRNGRQTLFPGVDGKTKQPRMQDMRGCVRVGARLGGRYPQ